MTPTVLRFLVRMKTPEEVVAWIRKWLKMNRGGQIEMELRLMDEWAARGGEAGK